MRQRKIFRDKNDEEQFWDKGYITHQLLTENDISYLLNIFQSLRPDVPNQFYATIDSDDREYRLQVDRQIEQRIKDTVKARFIDYSPLIFNFIVKEPGGDSEVFLHVDITHVDEKKFQAVNIWCPLVNTTADNGALFVLPGSQNFPYPPRGFNMPHPYSEYHDIVKSKMEMVPLKAGEAIFYNNKLMHRSDPNRSNASRPAVIIGMLPDEAPKIIHFKTPEMPPDKVEIFELSKEFYLNFDRYKRPEGFKSLGIVDYKPLNPDPKQFISMLNKLERKKNYSLFKRIKNLLIQ